MSSPDSHEKESKGYSPHMRGVALGILVMGVSLAAVIILWTTIGYKGPDFSTQVMVRQQERLHEQYGLPPLPDISPEMLQVPPSLRTIATGTSAGGGTSVSIVSGSSSLTDTAYQPNPIQVSVGTTVTWTNDDSQPHTVTSGSNGQPDNKFNSSPNFNPLLNPGQTFSFTFTQAGDYPYFCMLHPNMVGTVNVSS